MIRSFLLVCKVSYLMREKEIEVVLYSYMKLTTGVGVPRHTSRICRVLYT